MPMVAAAQDAPETPQSKMDEVMKRKLEAETTPERQQEATKDKNGSRAEEPEMKRTHLESVPAPMAMENFSPELLRIYYENLFPFHQMFRWLSYGNHPKGQSKSNDKDFFLRREFTFVLAGDVYCRYQCFRDHLEWKQKVMEQQPMRMEIGAVYTAPPKIHNTITKDAYYPLQRELVFDIDMDDYDDIRHCCKGANVCKKCWSFLTCAIQTLNRALREDFGFQHLVFVYSGRRGCHCWIGDAAARNLSNEQRNGVAEYLNLVKGAGKCKTEISMNGCEQVHPSVKKAYKICLPYFEQNVADQDLFKQGPHLEQVLEVLNKDEHDTMRTFLDKNPDATSLDIWKKIKAFDGARSANKQPGTEGHLIRNLVKEIVLQHSYPRLDINVSKQMNHLLKAPFVIHPKTGRVCVPIDPETAQHFDPAKVPTVGQLVGDLNAHNGDVKETALKQYTHFFEQKFLQPLEASNARERNDANIMDF
jgi:DNA primase small subunit